MIIIPPNPLPSATPQTPTPKPASAGAGPTFGEVLDQAKAAAPQRPPMSAPAKTTAVNPVPMGSVAPPQTIHAQAMDQVEESLAVLETYRLALANPQNSLRTVAPLVTDLDAAQRALDEKLADLPSGDPLRQLGNQASAALVAETARFNSGIYN